MAKRSVTERFWSKVLRVDEFDSDACWLWQGHLNREGYGRFNATDRMFLAHRWAWQQTNGPIPEGMTLDHLCFNPACVRPDHLEPVTDAENKRRAQAARTHCKRGHPRKEFGYLRKTGAYECRACKNQWARNSRLDKPVQ